MSLLQQLTSDMVSAMKNRDKETLNVVRMLKAAVQNEQIELGHDLSANEEIAVMAREYKQRKESLEEFEKAGREDLINQAKNELAIVEKYMPKQLSKDEVTIVYCYNQQCHLGDNACLILAEYDYPTMLLEGGFDVWVNDFRFATVSDV